MLSKQETSTSVTAFVEASNLFVPHQQLVTYSRDPSNHHVLLPITSPWSSFFDIVV